MSYSFDNQTTSNQTLFSLCNQRKHQRYYNSQGSSVELLTDAEEITQSFKGMILDDSFGGCGLIVITEEKLLNGQLCQLKLKNLDPILCQIVWLKRLDKNILRLGVRYLMK
ncbi:MAG: PilZ domain-containing protein [Crocosphaera sp.]|nr:PilZ domain-containing protein [Crocosphaera sp.]